MDFKNEAIIPGDIGYFFVALSFTASLLSLIAYFIYSRSNDVPLSWRNLGRVSFGIHGLAVLGIMVTLFYLIYNHYFEYYYVWSHSSKSLSVEYMISCFWEGQEGSFLLWTFWHVVLGGILIKAARQWEGPVMTVVLLAQVTLSSMLLGFTIGTFDIGSNPFVLLRNAKPDAPIFQFENYLSMIEDGRGLNPLLQNYWMVIHPPVLFLGFASTIVPFAFAIAGLWKQKFKEWIKPALPWTHFSILALGTGVLMGGAWAYEALNFGGFWAWDPVENAALVPWLLLVAGLHGMVIFKNRGTGLKSTLIFIILGFLLILYATFLTRSGVLGDSSVHSFTDLGLSGQLLIFIFIFLGVSAYLMIRHWSVIPGRREDDNLLSREFWMYIGALVLTLSAFHVTFVTSFPVINKIPGVNLAPPADLIQHYNKVQLPIAVVILMLSGFSQFLKYKVSKVGKFFRELGLILLGSAVLTGFMIWLTGMENIIFSILLFASVFGVVGNAGFIGPQLKSGKFRFTASSISHIGFALLIMGALISTSQQQVISINKQGVDFGENFDEKDNRENIFLQKFSPKIMEDYMVTYVGDTTDQPNTYYKVQYNRLDPKDLDTIESFELRPRAQINENMGLVASPDTRHYWDKDIYTHVTSVPDKTGEDFNYEYDSTVTVNIQKGETIEYAGLKIKAANINPEPDPEKVPFDDYRVASTIQLKVANDFVQKRAEPVFVLKDDKIYSPKQELENLGLMVRFTRINPQEESFELTLAKGDREIQDYIIMKAIVFPYINLLWLGCLVMVIGLGIGVYRRQKDTIRLPDV